MRAGVYVRISQDRQGARGGVERQTQDCLELCERRDWEVAGVYEDNDVSAFSGKDRPAYSSLLADVADGLVDVVVAWHTDRLWRSVIEQQVALATWADSGLAMVATCSGGDVNPSSADDGFVSTIHAAVAQHESATKSRRARRKAEQLVAEGRHTGGGYRPFGHSADRQAVVEVEAAVVRECCDRVASGEAIGSVVADLNARDILTSTGRQWRPRTLTKLLRQPRLVALVVHRGRIVGDAHWPPLVDRGLWERTQAALDARRATPRAAGARSLLGGVLVCGRCGKPFVSGGVDYRCPTRAQGGCGSCSVTRAWVDEVVGLAVVEYLASPAYAEAVAERARDSARLDEALAEVGEAEARLATLDAMFSAGEVVGGDYRSMRARLVAVLAEAREAVAVASGEEMVAPGVIDWAALSVGRRRAVVQAVLAEVTVAPVGKGHRPRLDRLGFVWRS